MKTKLKTCGSKWAKKIKEHPENGVLSEPKMIIETILNIFINVVFVD